MESADTKLCEDIINASNPFQCFNLPIEPIEPSVVRTLYLKTAVKVHPDKNTSTLATQAFQILSESFEVLHDEEKQEQWLKQPSAQRKEQWSKRKKKKKAKDIADKVVQTSKWYTHNWEFVESEIQRMTNEFKEHLAKKQEKHEKQLEKRAEKNKRRNKRIKKNLNYLYEKYGIDPSSSEDEHNDKQLAITATSSQSASSPSLFIPGKLNTVYSVYNDLTDVHADAKSRKDESIMNHSKKTPEDESLSKPDQPNNTFVCWTCRRSFTSNTMLGVHYEKSDLHKQNLEKANNSKGKFKRSFSEVPESR